MHTNELCLDLVFPFEEDSQQLDGGRRIVADSDPLPVEIQPPVVGKQQYALHLIPCCDAERNQFKRIHLPYVVNMRKKPCINLVLLSQNPHPAWCKREYFELMLFKMLIKRHRIQERNFSDNIVRMEIDRIVIDIPFHGNLAGIFNDFDNLVPRQG